MSNTTTSLSLKPWTTSAPASPSLKDVLARVNIERGHFRDITEASLQEEIAGEGALSLSNSDDEDEEEDGEGTKRNAPTTRQELFAARQEIVARLAEAHQESMMGLDFMSLLESEYAVRQASVTMSPSLRQNAPVASLAADVWHRMPQDTAREAQDSLMASKVRIQQLQDSADDLIAASKRLQENVRKETLFWEEMHNITQRGWSVSRIPGPRQRLLGVHFGFNGSAPEFATRNIAALVADSEGQIGLERGIGSKPKAVRALVRKGGKVVGVSRLPSLPDDGKTTLEVRIRHARDSVYDEELYHEMIREARTLTSMGVTMKGSAVSFPTSSDLSIEMELLSLDEENLLPAERTHDYDHFAQAALIAACLLLGQAHREKLKQKSQPPQPMTTKADSGHRILPILRPLILLAKHHHAVSRLSAYLDTISHLLNNAQIPATITAAKLSLPISIPSNSNVNTEALAGALLRPFFAEGTVKLVSSETSMRLSTVSSPATPLGDSFSLLTQAGTRYDIAAVEDLAAAADEFLAIAIADNLHKSLDGANGWEFDAREGVLIHSTPKADEDEKERVEVIIDSAAGEMRLVFNGEDGLKEAIWKVDGAERRSLKETWESFVE